MSLAYGTEIIALDKSRSGGWHQHMCAHHITYFSNTSNKWVIYAGEETMVVFGEEDVTF